jgi:lysozyme
MRHRISRAGIELIKGFEGLRRKAARLPSGRWTIGYGHTASAREGAEVSAEDAEALLLYDLLRVGEAVRDAVKIPLRQNEFDALVAFAHNVGVDTFRESEVLRRVNENRLTEAACEIDLWRRAALDGGPVVLDALIRRRAAEKALFLSGVVSLSPTPLLRPNLDPVAAAALPTTRPIEIETSLEGDVAEVRRVGPPDAPTPRPTSFPAPQLAPVTAAVVDSLTETVAPFPTGRPLLETVSASQVYAPEPPVKAEDTVIVLAEPELAFGGSAEAETVEGPAVPDAEARPLQFPDDVDLHDMGDTPLRERVRLVEPEERVVRHEVAPKPANAATASGPHWMLGGIGLAAFAGSIAAFVNGRAGGADDMTAYAWILALLGVGCVATAVYFLLKRLGGGDD